MGICPILQQESGEGDGGNVIEVIPEWLKGAVDWLNKRFPENEHVTMTVLYGYDCVSAGKDVGFAAYDADEKNIMLADPEKIYRENPISEQEMRNTTITSLFHEYRHHQQNIKNLHFDEEDAEVFAERMYRKYIEECIDPYETSIDPKGVGNE